MWTEFLNAAVLIFVGIVALMWKGQIERTLDDHKSDISVLEEELDQLKKQIVRLQRTKENR